MISAYRAYSKVIASNYALVPGCCRRNLGVRAHVVTVTKGAIAPLAVLWIQVASRRDAVFGGKQRRVRGGVGDVAFLALLVAQRIAGVVAVPHQRL